MHLQRWIHLALLIPSLAFAQNNEQIIAAPPPDSASSVRPESQATPEDLGTALPEGYREQILAKEAAEAQAKLPQPVVPAVTQPTSSESSGGGAGAMIAGLLAACGGLFAGNLGTKNTETADSLAGAMDRHNDDQGFQPQEDFTSSEQLGAAINANYPPGCENNFIDKNGNLGPWGRTALQEIRNRPNEYVKNDPPDVLILCKNYSHFDASKREQFWVWMFSSLAAPESSCNPNAANKNAPNGTAIGLFQIEKPFCDRVGVYNDLYNPHQNTRCAVRGLATELARRDNLMSPTSRSSDSRRTYWGPLRTDDNNKARGGDIRGAQKFRSLVGKFPGCGR